MSFMQEPSITLYTSDNNIDSSVFPNKYLKSLQNHQIGDHRMASYSSKRNEFTITDKNKNNINNIIPLTQSWYQPGSVDNQYLLDHYGITDNQQYRKHMTNQSVDICNFNNKSFMKTIQ
jgi:hypothetical protein